MGAFNIEITAKDEGLKARYHSEELDVARKEKMRLVHWIAPENVNVKVVTPEEVLSGLGEAELRNVKADDIIQFERFGFVRVDTKNGEGVTAYFTHK